MNHHLEYVREDMEKAKLKITEARRLRKACRDSQHLSVALTLLETALSYLASAQPGTSPASNVAHEVNTRKFGLHLHCACGRPLPTITVEIGNQKP